MKTNIPYQTKRAIQCAHTFITAMKLVATLQRSSLRFLKSLTHAENSYNRRSLPLPIYIFSAGKIASSTKTSECLHPSRIHFLFSGRHKHLRRPVCNDCDRYFPETETEHRRDELVVRYPGQSKPKCKHWESLESTAHMTWTCLQISDGTHPTDTWEALMLSSYLYAQRTIINQTPAATTTRDMLAVL